MSFHFSEAQSQDRSPTAMRHGISRIVDVLLLAILGWYLTPDQFIALVPVIAGSRIITFLLLGAYLALASELIFTNCRLTGWARVATTACAWMTLLALFGLAPAYETKVFGNDLLTFMALLAGLVWASNRAGFVVLRYLRIAAIVSLIALALTVAGLATGILTHIVGDRVYTQSLFAATYATSALLPFLPIAGRLDAGAGDTARAVHTRVLMWGGGIAALFAAAAISGTRSVMVQTVTTSLVSIFSIVKRRRARMTSLVVLCVGAFAVVTSLGSRLDFLGERSSSTVVDEEVRFTEARYLLDQLTDNIATGWGFGSLFESPVVIDDYGKAAVPHIGVLTFAAKGGIVVFLVFVTAPLIIASKGLLRWKSNSLPYAAAGSLAVYFTTGVISGGWFTVCLFIYGVAISEVVYPRRSQLRSVAAPPGAHSYSSAMRVSFASDSRSAQPKDQEIRTPL